jgi:hypothetical protein
MLAKSGEIWKDNDGQISGLLKIKLSLFICKIQRAMEEGGKRCTVVYIRKRLLPLKKL